MTHSKYFIAVDPESGPAWTVTTYYSQRWACYVRAIHHETGRVAVTYGVTLDGPFTARPPRRIRP